MRAMVNLFKDTSLVDSSVMSHKGSNGNDKNTREENDGGEDEEDEIEIPLEELLDDLTFEENGDQQQE